MGECARLLPQHHGLRREGAVPRAVPRQAQWVDRRRGAADRHRRPHPGLSPRSCQARARALGHGRDPRSQSPERRSHAIARRHRHDPRDHRGGEAARHRRARPSHRRQARTREFEGAQADVACWQLTKAETEPGRDRVLPRPAHGAGAGISVAVAGELAVELADDGDAVGELELGAGGGERGILRRRGAVDDEARARQRLEYGSERRITHPVMRPGEPAPQRQHRAAVDQELLVEARAELAARIGRRAIVVGEPEATRGGVDLAVGRRAEALRLHRAVGRERAERRAKAPAALRPCAKTLRVEARSEMVAERCEAVG